MFKLAVTVAILAVIVATLEARFVDKVASAVVARKISLDKLLPRVVRVLISLLRLAVKVARFVLMEERFVDKVASAVVAREISLVKLAARFVRVVISLLRLAVKVARVVVRFVFKVVT